MGHFKAYGFLYGLIFVILLAWLQVRSETLVISLGETFKWLAIALIFALQGLSLNGQSFVRGRHCRFGICFVLSWNFLLFPLLVWTLIIPNVSELLGLGFFLLAIVPTTIALSVSYTDLSKGRLELALVSTLVSNLLGTVFVPIVFLCFIGDSPFSHTAILSLLKKIFLILVAPMLIGFAVRSQWVSLSQSIMPFKKLAVEWLLLGIIHQSFIQCFSLESTLGMEFSWTDLTVTGVLVFLLWVGVSVSVWWSSGRFNWDRSTRIALFFASSQKSICSGLPLIMLSLALYPSGYDEGLLLLPLIIYYLIQTILGAVFVQKFSSASQINGDSNSPD